MCPAWLPTAPRDAGLLGEPPSTNYDFLSIADYRDGVLRSTASLWDMGGYVGIGSMSERSL